MRNRVGVYVCSIKGISALNYIAKESIGHPCVTSEHSDEVFSGFKHFPGSDSESLPTHQRGIVDMIIKLCEENNLEYEVVDVANLGFMGKVKLLFKRIAAPSIVFEDKKIVEPTEEDVKALLSAYQMIEVGRYGAR